MASSDDDEDLRRAIALSLGQDDVPPPPTVDLTGDSDDDELRQAIALSLQSGTSNDGETNAEDPVPADASSRQAGYDIGTTPSTDQQPAQLQPASPSMQSSTVTSLPGLFGLDRKAMEQERLARLGKRKRSASPERSSKMTREAPARAPQAAASKDHEVHNHVKPKDAPKDGMQYFKGAVKRTWAYKHPRTNDIKIEEVFQGPPNIAVLSAMDWDDKWVFGKLRPRNTKQIWIMSAKGQDLQDKLLAEAAESNIPNFKICFPPMTGNIQTMHCKTMLLFHENYLRIVVPTANMTKTDWGEVNMDENGESWQAAVMENSLFLIDLPRRSDGEVGKPQDLTPFGSRLIELLKEQEVGKHVTEGVMKFDFAETRNIGFVHSIPGSQTAQFCDRTGLPGLATALRELGLHDIDPRTMELDYAASSLGAIRAAFLRRLYTSACGSSSSVPPDFLDRIRIYFPTKETVMNSTGGPDCGGIIALSRGYYTAEFPKQCMRNYASTRPGVLSHNKILLARGRKTDGTPVAWAYIGSANLSESAWGGQKELKSGNLGKLTVRNWECGVVVPVPAEALENVQLGDGEAPPMSVFNGVVEIPFQYPGERYNGKEPWFFNEHVG